MYYSARRKGMVKIILLLIILATPAFSESDFICLAKNIYHEARGESYKGQLAVALVTLNRVNSGEFENTICKVIAEPNQFTWYSKQPKITDQEAWSKAKEIAKIAIIHYTKEKDFISNALYFRTKPKRSALKIGNHYFY
jgi:spore germination cell wall hydrolase CwlJ-like protein